MRFLLITTIFPNPYQPTKGVFNLAMARALAREHEVRVVSPVPWVDELRARCHGVRGHHQCATIDGIEVHYPRYYYPPKILRRHYGWFLGRSVGSMVRQLLRSHRPDVVLGYWVHPDGEVAVRTARSASMPAVVMVGGSDVLVLAQEPSRRRCILDVLHGADAVVAVSQDLRAKLVGYGIPPEKVHVVSRGVDGDRFSPGDRAEARCRLGIPAEGRVLLWVGRMVPVKGLDVLLEACSDLVDRRVDFHLYLVGGGTSRNSLEAEARSRGLSERISFVGPQLNERLPDWYRAADLTVLPSRSEGSPNMLRESLACGTPFVASRVGGIPEIAEEGSSRLVAPGDPTALAEAIAHALAEWGPSSRPRSRSTGWAESAETLLRILRPLASTSANMGAHHAVAAQA